MPPLPTYTDPAFLEELESALVFGASKHSPDGWRRQSADYHFHHLCKHIEEYAEGIEGDEDTDLSPLIHAAARIMFLWWLDRQICDLNTPTIDRPPTRQYPPIPEGDPAA